jgi:hypothetical protein
MDSIGFKFGTLRPLFAVAWASTALFAATLAAAPPSPDAPLPVVRSWVLSVEDLAGSRSPPTPTHHMRIEMAMISGTRWTPDEILAATRGAAAILAQCGIQVDAMLLREFDGPRRYRYLHTPDSREFARRSGLGKPAVFFVDDTRQRPAFDAEAVGRANAASRPEMENTVWITAGIRDLPVALAHELVHVLTDSGVHTDAPGNLMREETAAASTRLSAAQCSTMLERGVARGLLR